MKRWFIHLAWFCAAWWTVQFILAWGIMVYLGPITNWGYWASFEVAGAVIFTVCFIRILIDLWDLIREFWGPRQEFGPLVKTSYGKKP